MVFVNNVVGDCRLVNGCQRFFPARPGSYVATHFFHLRFLFFQPYVKFPAGFSNVAQITVPARYLVNGICGMKGISFVLRMN